MNGPNTRENTTIDVTTEEEIQMLIEQAEKGELQIGAKPTKYDICFKVATLDSKMGISYALAEISPDVNPQTVDMGEYRQKSKVEDLLEPFTTKKRAQQQTGMIKNRLVGIAGLLGPVSNASVEVLNTGTPRGAYFGVIKMELGDYVAQRNLILNNIDRLNFRYDDSIRGANLLLEH